MGVGYRPSSRQISLEVYGNENAGNSLRGYFNDAGGTFDPAYNSPNDNRHTEFGNYVNRYFSMDLNEWRPDNTSQSQAVNVTSNYDSGSQLTAEANDSWLSVSPSSGLYGNFQITITVEQNNDGYDRSAQVFIKYGENVLGEIYVYQYA